MKRTFLILSLPLVASAFSSIPAQADPRFSPRRPLGPSQHPEEDISTSRSAASASDSSDATATATATVASAPWRIVMDIGREPLARMPFDWARSGCRMPLVVPCDFEENNLLIPQKATLSFTGPDGANVKRIEGGKWKLTDDSKQLSFSLNVPDKLTRRDVYIDAGTELSLTGRVYTQAEMDQVNADYYEAREELWQAGGEIGDVYDRANASKKWNEETGRWERRYASENPLSFARKQLTYWGAKAKQSQKLNRRPDINTLSDRGVWPGKEDGMYIANGGVVRVGDNGPVCGTWSAQPITTAPASYRGGN